MARVEISVPDRIVFCAELAIRVSDINFAGHLAHDSILTLIHEARAQYFASMGYLELDVEGKGIVVADAAIIYKSEAFYAETLTIALGIDELREKSFELIYRIMEKKTAREIAIGKTAIVIFDYAIRKAAEIPAEFSAKLMAAK